MNFKGFRFVSVFVTVLCLIGLGSCAHEQQLVSISIAPTSQTFGATDIPVPDNAGLSVQFRAVGTYIHPPSTKDITDQAVWAESTPVVATVNSTGLVTATGDACGGSLVSATVTTNKGTSNRDSTGAIVTGYGTVSVTCFMPTQTSGSTGPSLTVTFAGAGVGLISSSPSGLGCVTGQPQLCTTNFANGTAVSLTATPEGTSSFGGWTGCDSVTGVVCGVNLTGNRNLTATFN